MNPLGSFFPGLILNGDMSKIFLYITQMLEGNHLNVSLGVEIWKKQAATEIHRLFLVGKRVNAFMSLSFTMINLFTYGHMQLSCK